MATDNSLRIRVGAALDSNVRTVYRPLVQTTRDAASQVLAIWKVLSKEMSTVFGESLLRTRVDVRSAAGDMRTALAGAGRDVDKLADKFDELRSSAQRGLDIRGLASGVETEFARVERAAAKANRGLGTRSQFAERTGYWSMRYADNAVRTGVSFAQSIARGAGFDFNLGSQVRTVAEQQALATAISNEGFMPQGDVAANRVRVSGSDIRATTNAAADAAGFDRNETLEALQSFVGKTGDLQAGRDSLKGMATLARATGTDMKDLVTASADLSNVLGDIPGKGKEIERVMLAIAGQAKTGAVSIRDLPNSMAKLVAQARNFAIDPAMKAIFAGQGITTNVGMAVASMGVLAQAARQRGGATSAGVATNDAMAFIRDASSHAEMKRWADAGLSVFADKGHTMIRDPKQLILEALRYSGGDLGKLTNLFPNRSSRAVAQAFLGSYKEAGGGQAGLEAASRQYDLLAKSSMGDSELKTSFDAAMKETIPNVQIFQNKLQDVAEKVSGKVIPVFEKLEPVILELTDRFGGLVAWAADNPMKAVVGALTASVARAGVENAFRAAVETSIRGGGAGGGGGFGVVLSTATSALAIFSMAVTAATAGMKMIDEYFKKDVEAQKAKQKKDIEEYNMSHFGTVIDPETGKPRKMTEQEAREWAAARQKATAAKLDAAEAKMKDDQLHAPVDQTGSLGRAYRADIAKDSAAVQAAFAEQNKTNDLLAQILAQLGPSTPPIQVEPKGFIGPPAPPNGGGTGLPYTPIGNE